MANASINPFTGSCVPPFLDETKFPEHGGFIPGRFCASIDTLPGNPSCCLPCPVTDWTYPDDFESYSTAAQWVNVVGIILTAFMLLSYAVLPTSKTRSHYLSICLVIPIMMIAIGFTIPLAAKPEQCYNAITPNNMYSLNECAWSGSFIIAGGLATDMWIFIRALSMNLQICWDIVPGRKFFYLSQLAGWGVPAVLFTIVMTVTGVSFRFGTACHVNHKGSMGDFWIPLLIMAGAAGILQLITFGYCLNVYLKNLWMDDVGITTATSGGSGLPSYSASIHAQTARAVWQRLKKVLWLQWRGICIVTIIVVDVIFFSIVFVHLDTLQASAQQNWHEVAPWLYCLADNPQDKDACLPLLNGWIVNQPTVMAVLFLLSAAGLQAFLLLTRPAIFPAWVDFIRNKFRSRQKFVSLDAPSDETHDIRDIATPNYHHEQPSTTFEMQNKQPQVLTLNLDTKRISPTLSSPEEVYRSPLHDRDASPYDTTAPGATRSPPQYTGRGTASPASNLPGSPSNAGASFGAQQADYFGRSRTSSSERRYNAPLNSFSAPMSPSRQSSLRSVTFDPRDAYGRGGLGLNPPSEAGESTEDLPSYGHSNR